MKKSANIAKYERLVSCRSDLRLTPRLARERAGLTLEKVASAARICTRYLEQIERRGGASYVLASRLAHIEGAPITTFLFQAEDGRDAVLANERRGRNPRRIASRKNEGS